MRRELKVILEFIGSLWSMILLYILLHEGGHALVAYLCGAKIVDFNILNGYVVAEGESFNTLTTATFYIAGLLGPVIGFTSYLILFQKQIESGFKKILSALLAGRLLFSIGVWAIVPIQYMIGKASALDDVTGFIEALKINPLIMSSVFSLILSIYSYVIWKKRIFQNAYKALVGKI